MRQFSKQPFPVVTLKQLFDGEDLILDPIYQRNSVWTVSQKQLLIDSLFIGIDIPKIYLNLKNDKYEVVDGQQRIRSILEFLEDKFELPDESTSEISGKLYSQLDIKLKTKFWSFPIDAVILKDWSDDDIEGMFLRLQEWEPLNAAEKRRAIKGNFKEVVKELGNNKIFFIVGFDNNRYAYEDAAAKILHIVLHGDYTWITTSSIKRTYLAHQDITETNIAVKEVKNAFNFVHKAFQSIDVNPELKKWSVITLTLIARELLKKYNIGDFAEQFATTFLQFELERRQNSELKEEEQDPKYTAFSDAVRWDDPVKMTYRHNKLLERFLIDIPDLTPKDTVRIFSSEQRVAIYYKDRGICQICQYKIAQDDDYEADHILAHSKWWLTVVSNGQVLCKTCNIKKSNK